MGELNWDASERPELGPCDGQFFEDPDELAMKTAIRLSLEVRRYFQAYTDRFPYPWQYLASATRKFF